MSDTAVFSDDLDHQVAARTKTVNGQDVVVPYVALDEISSPPVTLTDRSGSITTGGQSQQLMPANPNRRGWKIQNTSGADLWFRAGGVAGIANGSFKLLPDGYYESPLGGQSADEIRIFGPITGQTFSAREW